jgi:hypothetical protein
MGEDCEHKLVENLMGSDQDPLQVTIPTYVWNDPPKNYMCKDVSEEPATQLRFNFDTFHIQV